MLPDIGATVSDADWSPWTSCRCDRASSPWCEHLEAAWTDMVAWRARLDYKVMVGGFSAGEHRYALAMVGRFHEAEAMAQTLADELQAQGYRVAIKYPRHGGFVVVTLRDGAGDDRDRDRR